MAYRRPSFSAGMWRERLLSDGSVSRTSECSATESPDVYLDNRDQVLDFNELTSHKDVQFDNCLLSNRTYTPQSLAVRKVVASLSMPEDKLFNVFQPPLVTKFYSDIRQSLRGILNVSESSNGSLTLQTEKLLKSVIPVLESASPLILRPNIFNLNPGVIEHFFAGVERLNLEVSQVRAIYTTVPGQFVKASESNNLDSFNCGLHSLYFGEILSLSQLTSQKLTGSVCVEHPYNLARLYCGKCNRTVCVLCCLKVVGKHSHHIVTKKTNMNRTRAEIILKMIAILNDLIQISITTVDAPLHVQMFVHFFGIPLFDTSKLKTVSSELVTLLGILNWFIIYTNMMTVGPPNTMDDFANILMNFSVVFKSLLSRAE